MLDKIAKAIAVWFTTIIGCGLTLALVISLITLLINQAI